MKSSAHFLIIFSHLNFVNTFCWATPGSGLPEYWAGLGSVCLLAYWHHNGVKSFPKKSQIQIRNTKSNCPKNFHLLTKNYLAISNRDLSMQWRIVSADSEGFQLLLLASAIEVRGRLNGPNPKLVNST